jgi:hypothetical protein
MNFSVVPTLLTCKRDGKWIFFTYSREINKNIVKCKFSLQIIVKG